jgi:hypothetical protein
MSLHSILGSVSTPSKTATVYGPELDPSLRSFLSRFAVDLRHEYLPVDESDAFVVVRDDGQFLGGVRVGALGNLIGAADRDPWDDETAQTGRTLLELLGKTTFSLSTRRHLLAVSRQIEERAWRIGAGTLHAGFQRLSAYEAQLPIYERLASERDLSVHVYGRPDWMAPSDSPVIVHAETADEIGRFWFVAFGGTDEPCALLAEQANCEYDGLWTFDDGVVTDLVAYLDATYG